MDQHKVPKLSLKHFAGQNGEVWTYDKRSGKSWPASPARTGVEAHYYSIEREDGTMDTGLEAEMSKLEGEAAPIYEKLVAGELPRGTDRDIYPAVVIPVVTQHYTMLQRNLLYTGLTRGKRLVVLVGQRKAVGIAVRGVQGRRRWSKLRELLAMDEAVFANRPTI